MAAKQTVTVPLLGGTKAGYQLNNDNVYDPSKPTLVMINSMCTTSSLFKMQFSDTALTSKLNLLAVEPLGHGATSCPSDHWTYWDTATMALQVMTALGIEKAFALGTSQGGWIVVRMALLAPERILGVLPLGTSMDYESADSRSKGAWDPNTILSPFHVAWTSTEATPAFEIGDVWCGMVAGIGFGGKVPQEEEEFWKKTVAEVYKGDEGRRKARGALACLLERDGLMLRIQDVKCPVHWLQGTEDVPYGKVLPVEQIKMFVNSKDAKLTLIEGGAHYLNATNPKEIGEAIIKMASKYA